MKEDISFLKRCLRNYNLLLGSLLADDLTVDKNVKRVLDRWNPDKFWHIYRSNCGHYSVIQTVLDTVVGVNKRCGKVWIEAITNSEI